MLDSMQWWFDWVFAVEDALVRSPLGLLMTKQSVTMVQLLVMTG